MIHPVQSSSIALALFGAVGLVTLNSQAQIIKADHTTVNADEMSVADLDAARALRMSLSHASVGGNIWSGLTALADADQAYAFPNWTDNNRGNPGWEAKIAEFESWVAAHADEYDVFQNKFCYIDQAATFEAYRDSMVSLAADYSDKIFVWWTMPIMTDGSDNALRSAFNEQVRSYCEANDLPLYDIADIESHTVAGEAVVVDGVEAMDPQQSSDGGHLLELGASRAAHAQWLLMSQLAGFDPSVSEVDTSSPTESTTSDGSSGSTDVSSDDAAADGGSGDNSGCSLSTHHSRSGDNVAPLLGLLLAAIARRKRRGQAQMGERAA